ncbi:PKD domain-containing protein [Thalassomonas haliotis]|uniref:PKD/Chitinase domain-containing protein n=1 Tax=Thalassomonas haliotis TaxID=485448 RepID=A0ABY7VAW9_9GAMM|nr:hypothetical protein [Thalassomonas haliotis]WDE10481.1 hypothetical protein H3N35_19770 [Thalassomonas haliotis]
MTKFRLKHFIVVFLSTLFSACGGGGSDSTDTPKPMQNIAPVANAGIDQTVDELNEVSLIGSGTDSDGSIVSYSWSQIAGTAVELISSETAVATFIAPDVNTDETLSFQLITTDNNGVPANDTVDITVIKVNQLPVAHAGIDQAIDELNEVSLVGSGTDYDGSIVSYSWSQIAGTVVELTNSETAVATFIAPDVNTDEILSFQLIVTDNDGAPVNDTVDITVIRVNQLPVADAGENKTVQKGTVISLNGNNSLDPEGEVVTYAWSLISTGTDVSISDPSSEQPQVAIPIVSVDEKLLFQLIVNDGENNSAPDIVEITVLKGCNDGNINSSWFCDDEEAVKVLQGRKTVQLPLLDTYPLPTEFGLRWRIIQALRLLGYEKHGIHTGETINATRFQEIDAKLAAMEPVIATKSDKLPNYMDISGPNFVDNLPQTFAAHIFSASFDLINSGPNKYQKHTNECVIANLIPQMCGALVDMGVSSGSCKETSAVYLDKITVQTPELFSFHSYRRDAIGADEHPDDETVFSTFSYVATLIHEMMHDLDASWGNNEYMHAIYDRQEVCSNKLMDYRNSPMNPFIVGSEDFGNQDMNDFVSQYASGLGNTNGSADNDYRDGEDFAETLSAYILLPEYFRDRMQHSTFLQNKYNWVRDVIFGGVEFTNPYLVDIEYNVPYQTSEFYTVNKLSRFNITDISKRL